MSRHRPEAGADAERELEAREQRRFPEVDRLAAGLHAEQANREAGCGNHTESYDDHMEWHLGQAERILRFMARLEADHV